MQNRRNNRKRRRKSRKQIKRYFQIGIGIALALLIGIIVLLCTKCGKSEPPKEDAKVDAPVEIVTEEPEPITASILTGGDIIMHDPFLESDVYLDENGVYNYDGIFTYIKETYQAADFTVLNLESTIADGKYKGYPLFRAPEAIATALANAGTDMCMLANNHIYDNKEKGFRRTIQGVKNNDMLYCGVRESASESTYVIQDINGIKVGFFNYVFQTGARDGKKVSINSIPVSNSISPLINTFSYGNTDVLYKEIETGLQEMKEAGVEYTIAYIHWGNEYQTEENGTQRKIAAKLCELGIDALIGGHPHVIQPVDLLSNESGDHQMVCVYSMGNHLSNQYKERMDSMPTGHTEDGLLVNLVLTREEDGTVALTEADFIPTWVYHDEDMSHPRYYIFPLNDVPKILRYTTALKLETDINESLERTNAIIGNGVSKVQAALPIQ